MKIKRTKLKSKGSYRNGLERDRYVHPFKSTPSVTLFKSRNLDYRVPYDKDPSSGVIVLSPVIVVVTSRSRMDRRRTKDRNKDLSGDDLVQREWTGKRGAPRRH